MANKEFDWSRVPLGTDTDQALAARFRVAAADVKARREASSIHLPGCGPLAGKGSTGRRLKSALRLGGVRIPLKVFAASKGFRKVRGQWQPIGGAA